jgi:hypothetical protein
LGAKNTVTKNSVTNLKKHLAKDTVCFFSKDSRKDNRHTVVRRLRIDGLLVTVANLHEIALTSTRIFQGFLLFERTFKWCGQCVPFYEGNRLDERISRLCVSRLNN